MLYRLLFSVLVKAGRLLQLTILLPTGLLMVGTVPAVAVTVGLAAQSSTCVGDCDNTGQVSVNEIVQMVNIALGIDDVSTCAAGDANGDGMISIDELLKAVNLALTGCPLTGSAAGEAASGVEGSTRDGADAADRVVGFGKAGAGAAAAVSLRNDIAHSGGAAAIFSCPAGGEVKISSCTTASGLSILTAVFTECRDIDPTTQASTSRSGTLKLSVADAQVCATGLIPSGVPLMAEYTQFLVATAESGGPTIVQVARLTDSFQPSGQGCGAVNGTDTIDGALTVQHDPAGPVAAYTYRNFVVQTSTVPNPGACIPRKTLNGALSVDDRVTGRHFSETARDFVITNQSVETQRMITESGILLVDCIGEMKLRTVDALLIDPGAPCPFGGVLEVALPDGGTTQVRFNADGVAFDFNGDGQIDTQVRSCLDQKLAQCKDNG